MAGTKRTLVTGVNDLASTHPHIAADAYGWDPSVIMSGSGKKLDWHCSLGHVYQQQPDSRTRFLTGCPYCAGQRVLAGFNDLATTDPEIAAEAYGWDPTTVTRSSHAKKHEWWCAAGHSYMATVATRVRGRGCSYCSGQRVLAGFNDLATVRPDIAAQAHGWDPTTVTKFSHAKKREWLCPQHGKFTATVAARTTSRLAGCRSCGDNGFNPSKSAWLYLMARHGEQQVGITGTPSERLAYHKRKGWQLLNLIGPFNGHSVFDVEVELKRWLKTTVGILPGTHENWSTANLEVGSLVELFAVSGVAAPAI